MELIYRHPDNPILQRDTIVGYDTLFNPGVTRYNGKVIMAVRAARDSRWLAGANPRQYIYTGQICDHLLFESSDDGETFVFTQRKITGSSATWIDGHSGEVATPSYFGPYGTEDCFLCRVGDQVVGVVHVMTHEPYRGGGIDAGGRVGLILTSDLHHFQRYVVGPQLKETARDWFIVEQADRIAVIVRIKPDLAGVRKINKPSIQVTFFDDLEQLIKASPQFWQHYLDNIHEHMILAPAASLPWESEKLGTGAVLEHDAGYILFYHGVNKAKDYTGCVALLDKRTFRAIARLPVPLLPPETWYEAGGRGEDVNRIIFPGAAIYSENNPNEIKLYYGAADTHVCCATIPDVDALVEAILQSPVKGIYG
jgi:predicted GH43/DUF377 family glycosyl hydrolase